MAIQDQADVVRSPQQAPPAQTATAPANVTSPPSQDASLTLRRALGNQAVERASGPSGPGGTPTVRRDWAGRMAQAVMVAMDADADGDWNREGGPWYLLNGHNPEGLLAILRRLGPEGREKLAAHPVDGDRYDKPRLDLAVSLAVSNGPAVAQLTALDARRDVGTGVVRTSTPLRKDPKDTAAVIARLPVGGRVDVTGRAAGFFHVNAGGAIGYVAGADLAFAIKGSEVDPATAVPLDLLNWLQVIPDATAGPGPVRQPSNGVRNAQGPLVSFGDVAGLPTTSYHQQDGHDLAIAGPKLPQVTDQNIAQLVQRIADVRAAIPPRNLTVQNAGGKLGFLGATPTESYSNWYKLSTTKPTKIASSDMRWRVFRRMAEWEGSPAAVQTWDVQNVTYGAGFAAASGQFEQLMYNAFKRSSDVASAFAAAGLAMVGGDVVVVDPVKRWKLHGTDAILYLRSNTALLSLMKNVAEDVLPPETSATPDRPDPRQAILDANFETLLHNALSGIPVAELGSDVNLAALKVHAIHGEPGIFKWSEMKDMTTIAEVVDFIDATATTKERADNIVRGLRP